MLKEFHYLYSKNLLWIIPRLIIPPTESGLEYESVEREWTQRNFPSRTGSNLFLLLMKGLVKLEFYHRENFIECSAIRKCVCVEFFSTKVSKVSKFLRLGN